MRNEIVAAVVVTALCVAVYLAATTAVIGCASMFVMAQP